MSAETVVANSAVVIALASPVVSVWQAHVTRQHNRHWVRPVLQLHRGIHGAARSGIKLVNVGLGPAAVLSTCLTLNGVVVGCRDKASVDVVRTGLPTHLNAVTFGQVEVLAPGYDEYLLSIPAYDPLIQAPIEDIFSRRLGIAITYESLYGGEDFRVVPAGR